MAELTGRGTLYDADENELGAVAYRIRHGDDPAGPLLDWGGELTLEAGEDVLLDPGRYVLETEDGTRGEVEVEPAGAASGAVRQVAFTGVGVWGRPAEA